MRHFEFLGDPFRRAEEADIEFAIGHPLGDGLAVAGSDGDEDFWEAPLEGVEESGEVGEPDRLGDANAYRLWRESETFAQFAQGLVDVGEEFARALQ